MQNALLEKYASRLKIAESFYSANNNGKKMDKHRALTTAVCLENLNKVMTESFNNSVGTQRSDMGLFKKFTMALTNVAVPNLIAFDLVIVQPMTAASGYVTYIKYTYGTNKGKTAQGTVINTPFGLGDVDVDYTSANVLTEAKAATSAAGAASGNLNWMPVIAGKVEFVVGAETITDDGEGNLVQNSSNVGTIDYATGAYSFTASGINAATPVFCNYVYDNIYIPQNDLPILNAEMAMIPLTAKARRIAIYYSQMAAFQAKQDYGFSLEEQLAEKAVGELSYEIDTEVTNLLIDNAQNDGDLVWSKTLPVGVSKQDHYAAFTEVIEQAKQKVYKRTKRFMPNYMLVASDLVPVLSFIPSFDRASVSEMNGPYFAGTISGMKVFVTPNIEDGKFVIGVNGSKMETSAAVYAPYMAIVPTQLLGFADGGNSQGFSTMYDLQLLNKDLLVAGRITA